MFINNIKLFGHSRNKRTAWDECDATGGMFCWAHCCGQLIASSHESHGSHTLHTAHAVHAAHATAGAQLSHAGVGSGHNGQEHVWLFGGHSVQTGGTLGEIHALHVAHIAHVAQAVHSGHAGHNANFGHGCEHWGHCGHEGNGGHGGHGAPQYVTLRVDNVSTK